MIPFNRPPASPNEARYLAEVLSSSTRCGDGKFTRSCHSYLERLTGCGKALLTTSCTDALEMSAILLRIGPGDEVIVPSFTFVSTANAFALHGAKIIFCDIRSDTLNIDERQLSGLITSKTKAVVVVHYAGVACEMDEILSICSGHGVPVIEDNAHGLFGSYRGRMLGSFGALATQSFHETKNVSCGEGGALLINDPHLAERAEIIREKGTNRSLFFRGQVDKYSWVDIGSSYLMSDILAAILLGQFDNAETSQEARRKRVLFYGDLLQVWASRNDVIIPVIPVDRVPAWHMFYMITPDLKFRSELISYLKSHSITAVFHYLPLNVSVMGMRHGGFHGQCPVTENISDRLIRLPLFNQMTDDEQNHVVQVLTSFGR